MSEFCMVLYCCIQRKRCHGNYENVTFHLSIKIFRQYTGMFHLQLVSCNLSFAVIWQMTYTNKLSKLCSATLKAGFSECPPSVNLSVLSSW